MLLDFLIPWRVRPNFYRDGAHAILSGLYFGAIFPFVAFIARHNLNASELELGLLSVGPFVGSLLSLPLTPLFGQGDVIKKMAFVYLLARIVLIATVFATSSSTFVWTLFVVMVLQGLPFPTHTVVLRAIYPDESRGRIIAYTKVMLMAAMVTATFVSGLLIETYKIDWRWVILGFIPIGIGGVYFFFRLRPPSELPKAENRNLVEYMSSSLRVLMDDKRFRMFAVGAFLFGFGNLIAIPVYTLYQVDVLKISSGWVAILTNTAQVIWMLSYVYWGRIIDRSNPVKIVTINSLLTCIMPLNHIIATDVWLLLPMAVVQGVISGGIELSYFNSIVAFSSAEKGAQYQGVHAMLLGVRGVTAPFIGAALAKALKQNGFDIRWVFVLALFFMVCGSIVQWRGHLIAEAQCA